MQNDDLDARMEREADRQIREEGGSTEQHEEQQQQQESTTEEDSEQQQESNAGEQGTKAPEAQADNKQTVQNTPELDLATLDRLSGGKIKTVEDFNNILGKSAETDVLSKQLQELQSKLAVNPYADEYEQKRNELKKSGASKDQLKAFETVNDLGDISEMDATESLVMKLVLVDGYSEKVARNKVEKQYGLENKFDDDLEIAKEELELAAKEARTKLSDYKAQVSTPVGAEKRILNEAQKAELENGLKPALQKLTSEVNSLTTVSIKNGKGEEEVSVSLDLDADGKAFIASQVRQIMLEENLPMTEQNYAYAVREATRDYTEKNLPKITESIWKKAKTHFEKVYSEKYENTGGKPRGENLSGQANIDAELRAQKDEFLGRTQKNTGRWGE